jgi:SnoaL-like domain
MGTYCAECGCLVDHGVRVGTCDTSECCCADLPILQRTTDQIADRLEAAFATKDFDLLGQLLAPDARWGDDDHPNKCRSRSDVISTFDRLLGEGVDGTVRDTIIGPKGVAVLLHVEWPNPGEGRGVNFYQAYLVHGGLVTEIQRHDDRKSAVAVISN